jgi:hypothetical protein
MLSAIRTIQSRNMILAGHITRVVYRRNACRILMEKPEGRRPLGRQRRGWMDNIKLDLGEI